VGETEIAGQRWGAPPRAQLRGESWPVRLFSTGTTICRSLWSGKKIQGWARKRQRQRFDDVTQISIPGWHQIFSVSRETVFGFLWRMHIALHGSALARRMAVRG